MSDFLPFTEKNLIPKLKLIKINSSLSLKEKIVKLNELHNILAQGEASKSLFFHLESCIEDLLESQIRILNEIRERNVEIVKLSDIDDLKDGYRDLFDIIDSTLQWNSNKQSSLEGVINRGSLRAMLIDPQVSIKTKQEIMDNWEDFL